MKPNSASLPSREQPGALKGQTQGPGAAIAQKAPDKPARVRVKRFDDLF